MAGADGERERPGGTVRMMRRRDEGEGDEDCGGKGREKGAGRSAGRSLRGCPTLEFA